MQGISIQVGEIRGKFSITKRNVGCFENREEEHASYTKKNQHHHCYSQVAPFSKIHKVKASTAKKSKVKTSRNIVWSNRKKFPVLKV